MARPPGSFRVPSYRLHKASGKAVVTINGRDRYLGPHGSEESHNVYKRLIAEMNVTGGMTLADAKNATIIEIVAGFTNYAKTTYRTFNGYVVPLQVLVKLYGSTLAKEFTPTKLKAVRDYLLTTPIDRGRKTNHRHTMRSRETINDSIHKLRTMFGWAAENELIPASVHHGVLTVKSLQPGRTTARETPRVEPVDDATIEATLPFLCPIQQAIVRIQRLTGMRSGEVLSMKTGQINTAGKVWIYTPDKHKTAYLGKKRQIRIGPEAQEILKPYLKINLQEHIWTGYDISMQRRGWRAPNYSTSKYAGKHYTVGTYCNAVQEASDRADAAAHAARPDVPDDKRLVERWHPHQLRHACGTAVGHQFGAATAQAVLGHDNINSTRRYVAPNRTLADKVIAEVG